MSAAYVLMFEGAARMDSTLPEEERHWVEEVEDMLHPVEDGGFDRDAINEEERLADIEAMRQMGDRVNALWGGNSVGGGDG